MILPIDTQWKIYFISASLTEVFHQCKKHCQRHQIMNKISMNTSKTSQQQPMCFPRYLTMGGKMIFSSFFYVVTIINTRITDGYTKA